MLRQYYANKIKSRNYAQTNVAEVMKGVDAVFLTGGEDISPSLFKIPQEEANCGEAINATRDISDYTLWAYCIDKNIPALGVCRGEQMLGIVSGCKFTQDIPTYYAKNGAQYNDTHRMPVGTKNRTYARHVSAVALSRFLRTGFMHPRIKAFTSVDKCVGEAYTVRVPERDASALYEAVGRAPIGSILVIDRGHGKSIA